MQLLIARQVGLPRAFSSRTATVQAPQSPSLHPHFVPIRPVLRSQWRSVVFGEQSVTSTAAPLRMNEKLAVLVMALMLASRVDHFLRPSRIR